MPPYQPDRANVKLEGYCFKQEVLELANRAVAIPDGCPGIDPFELNLEAIREHGWHQRDVAPTGLFIVQATLRVELVNTTEQTVRWDALNGRTEAEPRNRQSAHLWVAGDLLLPGRSQDEVVPKTLAISPSNRRGGYTFISDFRHRS